MTPIDSPRARRLRAPILVTLALLLGVETVGGIVIFFARLANGTLPGETLHVVAGVASVVAYLGYQWGHWLRVRSIRAPLDRLLGFLTAGSLIAVLATGLALGWIWWRHRSAGLEGDVAYPSLLSAAHNITTMLLLGFVAAHVGAVLRPRDRGTATTPAGRDARAADTPSR